MIFWILFLLFSVRWWCKKTFETMGFNASWSQDSTIQCLRPFDYSLKAEGMLLEDVRRPPTPNHPTYTWGWRRRRSWWVEKGLLIKRGQKYLVTDPIILETRGFKAWKWHFMERRRYSRPVEQGFSLYFG